MTKRVWLSLLLALALAACCLSALAENTAATEDPVVLTLNGEDIHSSEVGQVYQYYKQQFEAQGMDFTNESSQQQLIGYVVNGIMRQHLVSQKAAELGFDKFTPEEEKAFQDNAQSSYDQMYQNLLSMMSDETKTDEENAQTARSYLEGYGYTVDALVKSARESEAYTRLFDDVTKDAEASYEAAVQEAKARYEADPAAFDTDIAGGSVYYTPEGYRTVKHILVMFDKAAELKTLREKLAGLKEGDAEYADTLSQIEELTKDIQPKLDEITAKIESGEDFQALIDEYGEDSGMKAGATNAETGYYMREGIANYVPEFTAGGMALAKVGDVSEPILTDYGFHFIRYNSDVPSGATPYEDVAETFKNAVFTEALDQWLTEASVVYPEIPAAEATPEPAAEPAPEATPAQ